MKIVLVETQAVHPTDNPAWNAVSVTSPERTASVTAAETGGSDTEFCLHHLILRVRDLEAQLTLCRKVAKKRSVDLEEALVGYRLLKTHADRLADLVEYSATYRCDNEEHMENAEKALKDYHDET